MAADRRGLASPGRGPWIARRGRQVPAITAASTSTALQKAYENNESGRKVRGGSTISQQTAKNVFLWPGRSYVRKGLEAWFTVLIETLWGKIADHGGLSRTPSNTDSGICGAEAASQRYFGVGADRLNQSPGLAPGGHPAQPLEVEGDQAGQIHGQAQQEDRQGLGAVRRDGLADCVNFSVFSRACPGRRRSRPAGPWR
ncbi:transglycosylase domain-containing protein [Caulobacter segnis]